MSFNSRTEEYYKRFIELQEKLRKSEEERLKLEMKFNDMVQIAREEEQMHYRKLRSQYKRYLEEDRRRQERNERIIRSLERIESRVAMLAAKSERFKLLRQQYQAFLDRVYRAKHLKKAEPPPSITVTKPPTKENEERKEDIVETYLKNMSSQKLKERLSFSTSSNLDEDGKNFEDVYSTFSYDVSRPNYANYMADAIMNSIYSKNSDIKPSKPAESNNLLHEKFGNKNRKIVTDSSEASEPESYYEKEDQEFSEKSKPPHYNLNDSQITNEIETKIQESPTERIESEIGSKTEKIKIDKIENKSKSYKLPESVTPTFEKQFKNVDLRSKELSQEKPQIEELQKSEIISKFNYPEDQKETHLEILKNQEIKPIKPIVTNTEINNYTEENEDTQQISEATKVPKPVMYEDLAESDQLVQQIDQVAPTVQQYEESLHLNQPYKESELSVQQSTENPPVDQQHDERVQPIQSQEYAENQQSDQQYNKNEEQVQGFAVGGEPIQQYQENSPVNQQYSESEQPIQQYDENGGLLQQYDQSGQPIQQYVESAQYDENGQLIQQYDESGQLLQQYDQAGQLIQQYDETGQPYPSEYLQYDDNGQPIQQYVGQYDEQGQFIQSYDQHYDESGQIYQDPLSQQQYIGEGNYNDQYQYSQQPGQMDQAEYEATAGQEHYTEGGEVIQQYNVDNEPQDQEYKVDTQPQDRQFNRENKSENDSKIQDDNGKEPIDSDQQRNVNVDEKELDSANAEEKEKKTTNVMDILDTDTESAKQDTKISNDSDFDFSTN